MNVEDFSKQLADAVGINIVEATLKKLAMLEAEKCVLKIERLRADLAFFEARFMESSEAAWEKFQKGEFGDSADIMEWMMLFENYLALETQRKRLKKLES